MSASEFKRKLRAILSADVAGYSRLMGDDDEATVRTLTGHREMMSSIIIQNQGQVIDSPGDNLLASFSSVTQAVDCAVEIQREMAERNAELSEDRKMEYRIGINLGEVIEEADRIYGDGVNIAARLESIAEPGGICISGIVHNQVRNKIKLEYEFLGKQTVKNISEPVPVYFIKSLPKSAVQSGIDPNPASILSDKPSIAVLPFVNMSKDPDQEYFSDGMSEEIISALAKLEGLKVISRTSAFHFKGKDTNLRTIEEMLKVDHILEGSVRKAGNRIRISAQLIKVYDDTHLWAETYDRELEDVFAIQDEISQAVVDNLKVKLLNINSQSLVKDYSKSTEAYELFLKGKYYEDKGPIGYERAIEYMEKAIQVDPNYAPAYAYLGSFNYLISQVQSLPPWERKPKVNEMLQKALDIDGNYPFTYTHLGRIKIDEYDWEGAESDYKRALNLNPGLSECHFGYSFYLGSIGRMDEALQGMRHALELDPLSSWFRCWVGRYLNVMGQFDQAIEVIQNGLELNPENQYLNYILGKVYGEKGMYDKAISLITKSSKNAPLFLGSLGYHYAKAGRIKDALNILNDILERSKVYYFSPYAIAIAYAGLGDKDRVFEWLERAFELRDAYQYHIKTDIFFKHLHLDPRWVEQMQKRGLTE